MTMEEKKLLKRKQKAEEKNNKRQIAEACFDLGDYFNLKHLYDRALKEYKESAFIYKNMGVNIDSAKAHRMIGEMYMMLGEFKKALKYEEIYLSLARQLDNKTEEQRAFATLGRAYLLQGQSISNSTESIKSLMQAEKAFTKSLMICESLKGKINNLEFMDMRARLLLNIGVVLEHLGSLDKALEFIHKAINISKCNDFYDLLHQCYLTEGMMYLSKRFDFSNALLCFNLAIDVASRLDNKASKQCEALILKADVLCKMSDFHSAKQALLKAWKLKTPDENEFKEIEKKLKIVAAMCYTEDLLITTDSNDYGILKNLYEKLGDGACSLKNYKKGVDYYLKMLENAEKYGDSDKQLIPIYVSLYQTYLDLEDYTNALKYYMKELNTIKDNPSELCNTYIGIAEVLQKADKDISEIESIYQCALSEAQKTNDVELRHKVEKKFLRFYNQFEPSKLESFKKEYEIKDDNLDDLSSNDEDEKTDLSQNTPDIGDDICIENITDVSEVDEDDENSKPKSIRKRGKGFAIKKNSKGETQLHQACISGNTLLATRLISQGHPVNVRDNAGWLPLHEACIHGHKDIVELLLKNNAHYNDRGGVQCDGITPMHDAASNGHLDIVELLIEFGASSSIKTDGGETVLDTLQQWRKRVKLTTVDHIYYETLCSKLHKKLDIIVQISPKKKELSVNMERKNNITKSSTPIKQGNLRRIVNDDDNSDSSNSVGKYKSKRNSILSDASSDDSSDSLVLKKPNPKIKKSGVSEYKNAMKALRNRPSNSTSDIYQENITEKRKKTAILQRDEVGEDWLDDDLKDFQSKKPKNMSYSPIKRKSNELVKSRNKSIEDISNPTIAVNNDYANIETELFDENILSSNRLVDSDEFSDNTLTHNFSDSLTSKQSKKLKRWKYQSSLIKSGFTRHKTDRPTGFEGYLSDGDSITNISTCSYSSNKSKPEEPDSTSENLIFNKSSSFQDKPNSNIKTGNTMDNIIPPISIKVKILEKLLLIPIPAEKLNTSTVDWLINEASKRYYKLEGVKPIFSLMTSDGAILTEDDPLSIVMNSGDLYASIKNWNLPPLLERYVECCSQLQIDVEDNVKDIMENGDSTNILNFSDFNLKPHQCHPIFKSLYHQSALTHLFLNNNILGCDGMIHLSSCLPTLKGLVHIDLKNNFIQSNGIKNLYEVYEKQSQELIQQISFDLSYNPIKTSGFIYVLKLSRYIQFKQLYLKACDINEDIPRNIFEIAVLNTLQDIDISLNQMSSNNILSILNKIDTGKIESLKMAETKLSNNDIMQSLIQCSFVSLKSIDLSRCNLVDSDIYQLLRVLHECDNICDVSLCYNEELTFLSLKRLITHRPIEKINLVGCDQIFKHMSGLDLQMNWFTLSENCKLSSLLLSVDFSNQDSKNKTDALKKMWQEYNSEKGRVIKRYNSVEFII